jgi:glycosyltransferase involved in cell wall biosynthesis
MREEKSKHIYYFTDNISTSFIKSDVIRIAKQFESVTIALFDAQYNWTLPLNCKIEKYDYDNYTSSKVLPKYLFLIISTLGYELIKSPRYFLFPKLLKRLISELLRNVYLAEVLRGAIVGKNSDSNSIYFSFWFNNWATVLTILKRRGVIPSFYSRTHGSDLYEFRVPQIHKLPFRNFQFKYVDSVFSVSKMGTSYLKEQYPMYSTKIFTNYLGTDDVVIKTQAPGNIFTIVSCSIINNIKRVYLIPQMLQNISFPIRWIHIGAELESDDTIAIYRNKLAELKKTNSNVEIKMLGEIDNKTILDLYAQEPIDLFISMSETEGLPVSMMEAISFGIPILCTNVGGCSEVATKESGILIEDPYDFKGVAQCLTKIKNKEIVFNHKSIRKFWEEQFNGEKNMKSLIAQIKSN